MILYYHISYFIFIFIFSYNFIYLYTSSPFLLADVHRRPGHVVHFLGLGIAHPTGCRVFTADYLLSGFKSHAQNSWSTSNKPPAYVYIYVYTHNYVTMCIYIYWWFIPAIYLIIKDSYINYRFTHIRLGGFSNIYFVPKPHPHSQGSQGSGLVRYLTSNCSDSCKFLRTCTSVRGWRG